MRKDNIQPMITVMADTVTDTDPGITQEQKEAQLVELMDELTALGFSALWQVTDEGDIDEKIRKAEELILALIPVACPDGWWWDRKKRMCVNTSTVYAYMPNLSEKIADLLREKVKEPSLSKAVNVLLLMEEIMLLQMAAFNKIKKEKNIGKKIGLVTKVIKALAPVGCSEGFRWNRERRMCVRIKATELFKIKP